MLGGEPRDARSRELRLPQNRSPAFPARDRVPAFLIKLRVFLMVATIPRALRGDNAGLDRETESDQKGHEK